MTKRENRLKDSRRSSWWNLLSTGKWTQMKNRPGFGRADRKTKVQWTWGSISAQPWLPFRLETRKNSNLDKWTFRPITVRLTCNKEQKFWLMNKIFFEQQYGGRDKLWALAPPPKENQPKWKKIMKQLEATSKQLTATCQSKISATVIGCFSVEFN